MATETKVRIIEADNFSGVIVTSDIKPKELCIAQSLNPDLFDIKDEDDNLVYAFINGADIGMNKYSTTFPVLGDNDKINMVIPTNRIGEALTYEASMLAAHLPEIFDAVREFTEDIAKMEEEVGVERV